jgi:hypothetical protein
MILGYLVFGLVGAVVTPLVVGLMMPVSVLDLLACALLGANGTVVGITMLVSLRDVLINRSSERRRCAAEEARSIHGA